MARTSKREEARTAFINIRVEPSFKARLEAHARIHGQKITTEAESLLVEGLERREREKNRSPETVELLAAIEKLIGEIEHSTGHKWHQGVGTWSAVQEMLATGPIMERVPRHMTAQDKKVEELFAELMDMEGERTRQIEMMSLLGLVTPKNHHHLKYMTPQNRDDLRVLAEDRLPPHQKENANRLITAFEELDRREVEIKEEVAELVAPYKEAIEEGRRLYAKPRRGHVLSAALSKIDTATNALLGRPNFDFSQLGQPSQAGIFGRTGSGSRFSLLVEGDDASEAPTGGDDR